MASMQWLPYPAAPASYLHAVPRDIHPLIAQLLWNRNIRDPDQLTKFLNASYSDLFDPFLLRDMDRAVERIRAAHEADETIVVFGDFDADGVTGTTLLVQALSALGLHVQSYLPHRMREGYGLNLGAIERIAQDARLLITVDCGISNGEEIARAQALGLDVIVLDHHVPPAVLPVAHAVVNPKRRDCSYPYRMLAGVGLAFKLIQALHQSGLRTSLRGRHMLDLVAVGTVSDVAPLHGENRILVKHGLIALNQRERPGIAALLSVAGVNGRLTAETIGFRLGPRINAAGRLDDARHALALLQASTASEAQPLAVLLNTLNRQRQEITAAMVELALDRIASQHLDDQPIIIVSDPTFQPGIVGLVAARLVEALGRPVVALAELGDTARGSARSIPGFSIIDAFTAVQDMFLKFGGHTQAAGCSLLTTHITELSRRLSQYAAGTLPPRPDRPCLQYDAELPLAALTADFTAQLALMEPFGHGLAEPLWITRNCAIVDARAIGRDRSHLKLQLRAGGQIIDGLAWSQAHMLDTILAARAVDIAYIIQEEEWRGTHRTQLIIKDLHVH